MQLVRHMLAGGDHPGSMVLLKICRTAEQHSCDEAAPACSMSGSPGETRTLQRPATDTSWGMAPMLTPALSVRRRKKPSSARSLGRFVSLIWPSAVTSEVKPSEVSSGQTDTSMRPVRTVMLGTEKLTRLSMLITKIILRIGPHDTTRQVKHIIRDVPSSTADNAARTR